MALQWNEPVVILEQKLSETFEEMRADGTMEEIIGRYLEENDMGVIADVE